MATGVPQRDDLAILNPSVDCWSLTKDKCSENQTLLRTLQPVMGHNPWLPGQVRQSLQSADTESFMSGNLTKNEAAIIYLLLRPNLSQNHSFYDLLQHHLISDDCKALNPFMPCLNLALSALEKLPRISGNVWYIIHKDLTELYPLGHVFSWRCFLRCYYNTETLESVQRAQPSSTSTLFSIISSSGRIVRQLFDGNETPQVILMPGAYFQIISISKTTDTLKVVFVKEITPPESCYRNTFLESKTNHLLQDDPFSIHPYWTSVLSKNCRSHVIKGILRVLITACDLGDTTLLIHCLKFMSDIQKLKFSLAEGKETLSKVLNITRMYGAFCLLQVRACVVLRQLAENQQHLDDSTSWSCAVHLVLEGMRAHKESEELIVNGLKLLTSVFPTCKESLHQNVLDSVLTSMQQHPKSKDIQLAGCHFINNLSETNHWVSLLKEICGCSTILTAIRLHRDDLLESVICWRSLLTVGNHMNNNNTVCVSLHNACNDIDFLVLVKEGIRIFKKHPGVQAEGLQAMWAKFQKNPDLDLCRDADCLELVVSALRHHSQSSQVVECSCGILSELTKTQKQAHLAVSNGGIACVLSAMNHHFNVPAVQEYGCKVLRTVAMNGYRPYTAETHTDEVRKIVKNCTSAVPDYRLKIIESGGREIVLSAMRTHLPEVGVQRQGCLAIRTLVVSASNVVETDGVEEISIVTDAVSKHGKCANLVTAALRAVIILIINPINKATFIQKNGVLKTLHAVRAFPNYGKIQEEGMEILAKLASDLSCASSLLLEGTLKDVMSAIDLHQNNAKILTSCCSLIASLCSANVDSRAEEDMLPHVLITGRGGFGRILTIMTQFRADPVLQIQGCRALHALAVPPVNTSMLPVTDDLDAVIGAMKTHPFHTGVVESACGAMGRLVNIRDGPSLQVPTEAIDQVLLALKTHPQKKQIQVIGLNSVGIIMTKDTSSICHITNSGIMSPLLSSMRLFVDEPAVQRVSLKILHVLLQTETTGSVWQHLIAFVIPREKRLWEEFCSQGGLEIVRDALRTHMSFREIVYFGGQILIAHKAAHFTSRFAKDVVELSEQIEASYKEDDKEIQALYATLKICVNKQVLEVSHE